ncbi:hypothetical protein REPUB_Repub16aG0151000 [Reevesia pubescens]
MGGTRFIGVFLSRLLVKEGHQVTLFTRGKASITQQLPGESDRDIKDFEYVKSSLSAEGFDVVYDINGRQTDEVEPILDSLPNLEQFIYCSSAGVYLKSDLLPHCEVGLSLAVSVMFLLAFYIYGPLNYNPVEEWFFHHLKTGRPIPIPNFGVQITQLGHVKDLAKAFIQVLGNEKASKQVFNISGEKYVTFDGLARACAKAGGFPEPEIVHYNPREFDFVKKKSFPFCDRGTYRKEADFSTDDVILGKSCSPGIDHSSLHYKFCLVISPQVRIENASLIHKLNVLFVFNLECGIVARQVASSVPFWHPSYHLRAL